MQESEAWQHLSQRSKAAHDPGDGGLYWDPVSQVTLGIGATYIDFDDACVDDAGITAVDDGSQEVFVGT